MQPNLSNFRAFVDDHHTFWGVVYVLLNGEHITIYLNEEQRELLGRAEVEILMQNYLYDQEHPGEVGAAHEYIPGYWSAQIF